MLRLILRVVVTAGAVVAGNALGGLMGAVIGACIGTIVVTQTEEVLRVARRSAELGGSGLQIAWRFSRTFFGHRLVRRFLWTLANCIFVAVATAIGNALSGQVGAIVASAIAVALGQSVPTKESSAAVAPRGSDAQPVS